MAKQANGAAGRDPGLKRNARNKCCGSAVMRSLKPGEARAVFLDPEYRGLLEKMKYGNEGTSREKARVALPQTTDEQIAWFVAESARVLAPSGYLFVWADKFTIGSGHHVRFFAPVPELAIVDLIHWNKTRIGMGRRARCLSEYLIVAQKVPIRAKGTWSDRNLPDSFLEQADRSEHPHSKPHQLTERLIRAVTKRGDLVVDPCAGSYVVLAACQATGRQFIGSDLN